MKSSHKHLNRTLPLLAFSAGASLILTSALQAQPNPPAPDNNPSLNRENGERWGHGRGLNRQFVPQGEQRGPRPSRLTVPTVEQLAQALDLTTDQQKKMASVLGEMEKRINNTLTAEQRTKLEQLRTQPEPRDFAGPADGPEGRDNGRQERGEGRPEGGQGMRGRGRQGMGGPSMGGPEGGRFGMRGQQRGNRQGMGQGDMNGGGMRQPPEGPRPESMDAEGGPRAFGAERPRPMRGEHDEDHGRPVEAIAKELGVTPEQFRAAFKKVTPARRGEQPTQEQRQANRKVLSETLGVSPERLDEVMDKYRPGGRGDNGPIR